MEKPLKNYFIYAILIFVTIFVTLFLSKNYINDTKEKSVLFNNISEIRIDDFEQFITENPDAIVYISNINNTDNIKFEKKFNKRIEDLNIKDSVVFINSETLDSDFLKMIKSKYNFDLDVNESTIMIINNMSAKFICVNNNTSLDEIDFLEFK